MDPGRRAVLAAGVTGGLLAAGPGAAQTPAQKARPEKAPSPPRLPPTPAAGDPDAPPWPAREVHRIWPGRQPGEGDRLPTPDNTMNGPRDDRKLWLRGVAHAELHVFRPALPDGSALLAIPGGGYAFISVQNEGIEVAQHFNALRTTVFVLVYRLPREGWSDGALVPIQDAQRAMRFIRARAADFRIDPDRLGVVGFSAGGHLAADLATAFADRLYEPVDEADQLSARPAFAGLIYAVTTLLPLAGRQRYSEMLGEGLSHAVLEARSPLLHIGKDTPPTFLAHALDDPVVDPDQTLAWVSACRAAGRPVEAHLFEVGGHAFALRYPKDRPGSLWPDLFSLWLRNNGG